MISVSEANVSERGSEKRLANLSKDLMVSSVSEDVTTSLDEAIASTTPA
jgi:hypothetical protein